MGIRDWPQQTRSSQWDERVSETQTVIRYVLDGTGTVACTSNDGGEAGSGVVGPGSIVEAEGDCVLKWDVDGGGDMVILTPGFEMGGAFLFVLVGLILLSGVLITGVGTGG
eukprot:CAMPEP_0172497538 /NCGR_PEP_ID=MMETSP1066-20121228/101329_1 /TAXON_ID=671091 /ORGANISM="Coscinodiscus wailesii, Strain CCMP2513" /LENGTH=110 /DNA_ID=CAMNT_0013270375 /DNA_START=286 /DNA_END=618 /DNA_ORIENTATION=-